MTLGWRSLVRKGWVGTSALAFLLSWSNLGFTQENSAGIPQLPQTLHEMLEAAPPASDAAGAAGAKPAEGDAPKTDAPKKEEKKEEKPFWAKNPPVTPMPRPGWFIIPPKGPGYYTLRDVLEDNCRENPPKSPWGPTIGMSPGLFFDADFRYLDDPKNTQCDLFDPLKRIHSDDDCWLLSFGGEFRYRHMHELSSRLSGLDNEYGLMRNRLYGDLWYTDIFRIYAEYIDAQSIDQELAPLVIDQNHSDLLNLFAEAKLFDINDRGAYVRVGRQELLYGSQRLISPLDWATTRRTFEGIKTYWHGEKWDVDAFWVRPVNIFTGRFDAADPKRDLIGLWTTHRPKKGQAIDMYYLFLEQNAAVAAAVPAGRRGGQNINTIGSRYHGDHCHFLWDMEYMGQFGTVGNEALTAGSATTGVGYHFAHAQMNPIFWLYYDYASGSADGGRGGTFNQLFPFGHYYMGYLDLVGRRNIHDLNMQLSLHPAKWITFITQSHFFYLDTPRDALYNAAGAPIRRLPAGANAKHVGNEIDFFLDFRLTQHQNVFVGYSKLFAGEVIRESGNTRSPELFYMQYNFRW